MYPFYNDQIFEAYPLEPFQQNAEPSPNNFETTEQIKKSFEEEVDGDEFVEVVDDTPKNNKQSSSTV